MRGRLELLGLQHEDSKRLGHKDSVMKRHEHEFHHGDDVECNMRVLKHFKSCFERLNNEPVRMQTNNERV